jgi:hypothetical protein
MKSENFSLSAFSESLSAAARKKAERLNVRECDEHPKGIFVAYVDEGDQSFDATVSLGKNKLITAHACDCGKGNMLCIHRIAMLLHLANGGLKKSSSKIPKSKKKLPHEAVLEKVDAEELKAWVASLFVKNKDLELAFMNHFNHEEKTYTIEDAILLTVQTRKAVIKNRRKAEVSEVRKIVGLWKELHQPIIDAYRADLVDVKMFDVFNALLHSIADQHNSIETGSKAIVKYLNDLLRQTIEPVRNLVLDDVWGKAIGLFVNKIGGESIQLSLAYVGFLVELANVCSQERELAIVEQLLARFKKLGRLDHFVPIQEIKQLLDIAVKVKLFEKYANLFIPLLYQNEYNLMLIDALIACKMFDRAERIALEQIKRNVRSEFDYAYYKKLKEIYVLSGDLQRLPRVIEFTFPIDYDYEDFLFMQSQIESKEMQKKWTDTIYKNAKMSAINRNEYAEDFCFTYLYFESKLKDMVQLINDTWDYQTVLYYFDEMHEADPDNLLKNIIARSNNKPRWYIEHKDVEERKCYEPLAEKIISAYTIEDIKNAISFIEKNNHHPRKGRFTAFLESKIN